MLRFGVRFRRAADVPVGPRGSLTDPLQPMDSAQSLKFGSYRHCRWTLSCTLELVHEGFADDLVLVQGVEPSLRWRAFSSHIVDLAEALGVQVVVSLGALLGDVPHTHPVAMTGHASDPALMDRLGIQASTCGNW